MKGIGLVLAGGGGKGAYQIGVWKYLREIGMDSYIRAVSGTSIGALNGALITAGHYDLAEKIWLEIRPSQALTVRSLAERDIFVYLINSQLFQDLKQHNPGQADAAAQVFAKNLSLLVTERALFSREGLIQLIHRGLDFQALQHCAYPCFATCTSVFPPAPEYFDLRKYNSEGIQELLLASSAIPVLFDEVYFNHKVYYDGGLPIAGDNIPIQPVYETGVEYILVVHLKQEKAIDCTRYPNAKILEIVPSENLGGVVSGTLDFTSAGSRRRLNLGYEDARNTLRPFVSILTQLRRNTEEMQHHWGEFSHLQEEFSGLQTRKEELIEKQRSSGFEDLYRQVIGKREM